MWTLLGALVGAGGIVLLGRALKGRDFIGLAAAMLFFALLVGLFIGSLTPEIEAQVIAKSPERDPELVSGLMNGMAASIAFGAAFLPGAFFVLLAKRAAP